MKTTMRLPSVWTWGTLLIALPIAIPSIAILLTFFGSSSEVWQHLRSTVLTEYIYNTVLLLLCVAVVTSLVGVPCAWLTATRSFPGRNMFAWALILPFAAPAYVVAYAYADMLDYAGPLQTWLRGSALWGEAQLPAIRSLPGAALVLGLVLYPYIYLFAYGVFAEQARPLTDAARTLGASPRAAFLRVALPHARPAIAGGLALCLMETAADFGVVDFYGVPTLTSGIFRTWYAQGEQQAALQLAGWLFLLVMLLVLFEQLARRGSHANPVQGNRAAVLTRLRGSGALLASLACALPLLLGFIVPTSWMIYYAIVQGDPLFGVAFFEYMANSLHVASLAAVLAVVCAVWLTYTLRVSTTRRHQPKLLVQIGVRAATLGYALPGMVLAVGLIGPLTTVDKWLARGMRDWFDINTGLMLTGSVALLVFVYLARFLTVAYNSCEAGMARIHPHYDFAARSLGAGPAAVLRRVHLPLLLPALLSAGLLVFIDVMKELPATLILRPFNFETLATRAYRLANDERLAEASTASLAIVLLGLIPALLLAYRTVRR